MILESYHTVANRFETPNIFKFFSFVCLSPLLLLENKTQIFCNLCTIQIEKDLIKNICTCSKCGQWFAHFFHPKKLLNEAS